MIVYKCDMCGDIPTAMYELYAKPMFGVFIEGYELTATMKMQICQSCFEKINIIFVSIISGRLCCH